MQREFHAYLDNFASSCEPIHTIIRAQEVWERVRGTSYIPHAHDADEMREIYSFLQRSPNYYEIQYEGSPYYRHQFLVRICDHPECVVRRVHEK